MSTKVEIQALLRFLAQDAKVPLATAMGKIQHLQKADLKSPEAISKKDLSAIQNIFVDEKLSKQVLNAAKRVSKKRTAPDAELTPSPKKTKKTTGEGATSPAQIESSLVLPTIEASEEELFSTILLTNRAPLVLAFVVTLLKYTIPEQPLSSRLSLGQAVVSVNSRSKAVSIGLQSGKSAEEEGFGEGQPVVKILGREIRVMKRWGYNPNEDVIASDGVDRDLTDWEEAKADKHDEDTQSTVQAESTKPPPLWGLDLEALRNVNKHRIHGRHPKDANQLPIYNAESARKYLFKSFKPYEEEASPKKKYQCPEGFEHVYKGEVAQMWSLAMLLLALDMLFASWEPTLAKQELDRRAWSWYVHVRPEVQSGPHGWGQKGQVKLGEILKLRKQA